MSVKVEYRIPTLNEKPTPKEILKAVPFFVRFIFSVAPGYFTLWIIVLIVQAPLFSLNIYATKRLIDAVVASDPAAIHVWIWTLIVAVVLMTINGTASDVFDDLIRYRLEYAKEERTIQLVSSLPFSVLERSEFRVLADAYSRKHYLILNLNQSFFWMLFYFASSLGLATTVFFIPWQIAGLLLLTIVIRFIIMQFEADWNWGLLSQENREGRRSLYMRSMLIFPWSILQVKAIDLHISFIKAWKKLTGGILVQKIKGMWKFSASWGAVEGIYALSFAFALFFLVKQVASSAVSIGTFTTFIGTYPLLWGRIGNSMNHFRSIQRDASFMVLIKDFFSLQAEADEGMEMPKERFHIRFDHVWFRYPGSKEDVLRGISFSIHEGDRIALVGLNGAGKSTILKLIMGVFQPTKGRILVNGVELAQIRPSSWRRTLSVLNQDVLRFDDTIENQILYGDYMKKRNPERLRKSIWASGLGDVLPDLKKGIKTHAGKNYSMPEDEAIELSGGQNQIVGIARTLYRDARMYIFDEPTSAVDPEKEERFFRSLPEVLSGKGIVFVSHRFSTLRQAEQIVVIDQGKVIEEGSHDELMYKQGRYAELFTLQAKAYQ